MTVESLKSQWEMNPAQQTQAANSIVTSSHLAALSK